MQRLKQALEQFYREAGIEKAVSQYSVLHFWDQVVGPVVAENTTPTEVEHGVLFVRTASPAWRQELQFQKQTIIAKLNRKVGKPVIKDIRFV
jgi:predicted nucleic acid-binding Zn ribbon protein